MSRIPVTGVNELVLEVLDLDAAERFYAGVLGLPVALRSEDRVWVTAGARTRIGLWTPQVGIAFAITAVVEAVRRFRPRQ